MSKFLNSQTPRLLIKKAIGCLALLLVLAACENETYDAGDGKYSYLRADFGEVRIGAATLAVGAVTDEGTELMFGSPYSAQWAVKADTIYRALIYYYDKVENGKTAPYSISRVPVIEPYFTMRPDTLAFDPIVFESAWVSKSGKYLNIGLYVMTGQADGIDRTQTIGVIHDGVETLGDGTRKLNLRLYHNQKGVPEYYSSHAYISIPLKDVDADQIAIAIPTYDGWKESRALLTTGMQGL